MQIHELNTFVGTPSATDYLAIDDGTETNKVPATSLGVSTQMTQAEAEAGAVTEPRVISPAVLNSFVTKESVLVVEVASFSSLPQTINNADITSDMVVVNSVLGTPSAQTSDWTVTAANGSVTVAGSISGSTILTLCLMKSRNNVSTSIIKKMAHFEEVSSKITISSAWNDIYKRAYKVGNVVFFSIEASTGTYAAETEYTIATLSNDIKPKYTIAMFGEVTDGNYIVKSTPSILCKNNGTITVRTTNTNGSYWFVNGWYYI